MDPAQAFTGLIAGGLLAALLGLALSVTSLVLMLVAVVSCMRNQSEQNRTAWVLIIIFIPLLGPLIYFAVAKKPASPSFSSSTQSTAFQMPPAIGPRFDHTAMQDEKQRAAAITAELFSKSKKAGPSKQ